MAGIDVDDVNAEFEGDFMGRPRLAAALPWLPRGVRIGPFSGGPLLPVRPRSLLRPMSMPAMASMSRPVVPAALYPSTPADSASKVTAVFTSSTTCSAGSVRPRASFVAITAARASKRMRQDSDARIRALTTIAAVILKFDQSFDIMKKTRARGEELSAHSPSMTASVATRKTATLAKRAGSLRSYERWLTSAGWSAADFFSEEAVFGYLGCLASDGSGGSAGAAFSAALNFAGGVFEASCPVPTRSPRVRGLVATLMRRRLLRGPRAPLTVDMVKYMEQLSVSTEDSAVGIFAGAAVFAILARLRIGDLRRCSVEPAIDQGPSAMEGFVETVFHEHKTAASGSKAALPVVAPLAGASGQPWASVWLHRRRAAGLSAGSSDTLLPVAAVGGGWTQAAMTTEEFGATLKSLLLKGGFSPEAVAGIGAHSCKATALSWIAKAAIPRDDRRALGYHIKPGDRTMEAYSRDAMAGPLRHLVATIAKVRAGRFLPDLTRSGYLADGPPSSTCSSPASVSEDSADVLDTIDVKADEATELEAEFVLNKKTGSVHRIAGVGLVCGKRWPKTSATATEPPEGKRLCRKCF